MPSSAWTPNSDFQRKLLVDIKIKSTLKRIYNNNNNDFF